MYKKAIEKVTKFTRPFLSISRAYGYTDVMPGCSTFIIVNDEGWILTCMHVAEQIRIERISRVTSYHENDQNLH